MQLSLSLLYTAPRYVQEISVIADILHSLKSFQYILRPENVGIAFDILFVSTKLLEVLIHLPFNEVFFTRVITVTLT